MMSTTPSHEQSNTDTFKSLIAYIKPHVHIHLVRSQFTPGDATDGFRREWVEDDQVEAIIKAVISDEIARGNNVLDVGIRKELIDKTVYRFNSEYSQNQSSKYYVPSHQTPAKNRRTEPPSLIETEIAEKARLTEEQLHMETKTLEDAVDKYRKLSYNLTKVGRATSMKPAEAMMVSWYTPLIEYLVDTMENRTKDKIHPFLFHRLDTAELACIALHEVVGLLMNSPGGIMFTKCAKLIGLAVESESNLKLVMQNKQVWRDLTRRTNKVKDWQINSQARKMMDGGKWDESILLQVGSYLLEALISVAKVPISQVLLLI
jgi:hypothetical protein